jgi:hypothetical protein
LHKAGKEVVSGGWSVARKGDLAVLPLAVVQNDSCRCFVREVTEA